MSEADYANLDAELPLALFPIRLETRYFQHGDNNILGIRIYPDTIHADDHHDGVTEREIEAGKRFWEAIWGKADDEEVIAQAQDWLAAQVGAYRAVWVAGNLLPTNLDKQVDPPQFPTVTPTDPTPIEARLMPDTWMVRIYDGTGVLVYEQHLPGPGDGLVMAPSLQGSHNTSLGDDPRGAVRGFLADQKLSWTIDFQAALRANMAIALPASVVPPTISKLLVVGLRVDRDPVAESAEVSKVLAAHRYGRGLDIVWPGSPTNNSDAGRAGFSLDKPDVGAIFEAAARPGPGAARGLLEFLIQDPSTIYLARAADSASLAFGHVAPNALDWAVNAHLADGAAQWAMNLGVGYATLGGFLSGPALLTPNMPSFPSTTVADLRDWYTQWVRGGAVLPTLRCGEQPYGMLPIMSRPKRGDPEIDFRVGLEHYLAEMLDLWKAALPVPALDPDAADARPAGSPEAAVADVSAVLGAVPNPTSLQLRDATYQGDYDTNDLHFYVDNIEGYLSDFGAGTGTPWENATASNAAMDLWNPLQADIDPRQTNGLTIDQQVAAAKTLSTELDALRDDWPNFAGQIGNAIAVVDQQMLPLLNAILYGTDALIGLDDLHQRGGVAADDQLKLASTTFSADALGLKHLVTGLNEDLPLADLNFWFNRAKAEAEELFNTGALDQRTTHAEDDDPLLAHLLDVTYTSAPEDQLLKVALAFLILERITEQASSVYRPDPDGDDNDGDGDSGSIETNPYGGEVLPELLVIETLERLLRESLGLAMYRLDAWILSLANERFAEVRKGNPYGLQIGCYGWLVDLERSHAPTSQGYIHAPSLNHAATAAVLRAGWGAYGTADADAPLSVDLSSERVRRGQWILDGLRNGQDLAEVLGGRFERLLHDAHLDLYITRVRAMVLAVTEEGDLTNDVVDGLLVARAATGPDTDKTSREEDLADAFAYEVGTATGADRARWQQVIQAAVSVSGDLDSVADLVLFQSVHSLIQGDGATAGAATAIASGTDADIPTITGTRSPRDGRRVSHRVVAVTENGASAAGIGSASPGVARWVRSILPEGAAVRFGWSIEGQEDPIPYSLDDLDVDVIEALLLAGDGPTQGAADLGRVLTVLATEASGSPGTADFAWTGGRTAGVTVNEFGLLAGRLKDALGRSRPLRADDLVTPEIEVEGARYENGLLDARIDDTVAVLNDLVGRIELEADRTAALVTATAIGIPGALVALEAGVAGQSGHVDTETEEPDVDVTGVIEALTDRLGAVPESSPATTFDVAEAQVKVDVLRALIGSRLPVSAPFVPVVALQSTKQLLDVVADEGPDWLRQAGRVRPAVGAVDEALLLAGVARSEASVFGAAQYPSGIPRWVATSEPGNGSDQLSVLSVSGVDGLGPMTEGVLFDAWGETVPRRDQVTGLAVHFDAPGARPPQSILLSTVESGSGFTADEVASQLLFTLDLAKIRALGPNDLEMGQVFPAVFLDDDLTTADDVAAREAAS